MEGGELFSRIQERADSAFTERGKQIHLWQHKVKDIQNQLKEFKVKYKEQIMIQQIFKCMYVFCDYGTVIPYQAYCLSAGGFCTVL